MTLELMGLAHVMPQLDPGQVRHWLSSEIAGQVYYPDVAAALAEWLVGGRQISVSELAKNLWRQVIFPEPVMDRIQESGMGSDLSNGKLMQI